MVQEMKCSLCCHVLPKALHSEPKYPAPPNQAAGMSVIDACQLSPSLGIALEKQAKESHLAQGLMKSAHIQWPCMVKV